MVENIDSEDEYLVEVINPNPPGGQCVGVTHYIVKITHKPTGLSACCGYERSQHKNKKLAMAMLEAGLKELEWNINYET